jgi:hypothetical protein
MNNPQLPFEQELYQRIDEVLHYLWDPIGVAREPFARDEYAAYVPEVFAIVVEGGSEQKLMGYLLQVEGDAMGLAARPSHARRIAEMLVEWRDVLEQKHNEAP